MSREKLAENLMMFVPLIFKKLMRGFNHFGVPKQQLGLLFQISNDSGKPMSYYSEKMMIPKSNLTVIADKLIEESLVERVPDPDDRRIITLAITKKGQDFLQEHKEKVRNEMAEKLDAFSESDINRLNELIDEMKEIFNKMS